MCGIWFLRNKCYISLPLIRKFLHEEVLEAAAKEGGQESLIPTEPRVIELLPTAESSHKSPIQAQEDIPEKVPTPPVSPINDPVHAEDSGTSAETDIHNLVVPEVLYLEAPPTQVNPPTTPILDADFTAEFPTTPLLNLDADDQILDDADTADSVSFDADNAEITGEAAINVDTDATGPSGHASQQALSKDDLVKKFVREDAPVPWSETPRGKEWTKEWNTVDFVPTANILAKHLAKADKMLINDDFRAQLREKQQDQIYEILKNQASQQTQLNEIQSSVELLVSLLLPVDAKKGEKVIKSKCKSIQTLKGKDDENEDQGNSERSRGHGQGKGFSSRKSRTSSQRLSSDAGKRTSFDKQTLKLKGKETTVYYQDPKLQKLDEEILKRLFLKDNPGMNLESLKEEEARLKAENVKSKSKASIAEKKLPKPKGIVMRQPRPNHKRR
ncbi:hypothetical protein AgCh_008427 [Apium graveolens]